MNRKYINSGSKKLGVWREAVSLYVLAYKVFSRFLLELKKVASNTIGAAHSISRNIAEGYCRRSHFYIPTFQLGQSPYVRLIT